MIGLAERLLRVCLMDDRANKQWQPAVRIHWMSWECMSDRRLRWW